MKVMIYRFLVRAAYFSYVLALGIKITEYSIFKIMAISFIITWIFEPLLMIVISRTKQVFKP